MLNYIIDSYYMKVFLLNVTDDNVVNHLLGKVMANSARK